MSEGGCRRENRAGKIEEFFFSNATCSSSIFARALCLIGDTFRTVLFIVTFRLNAACFYNDNK